jgi:RNA polymerase sigma factor (sigma-70 family)
LALTDQQTFVTEVATKHGKRLRRFLAARLRNAADVQDLAQEVFLRLMRVARHESIRTPEAYLFTVASHVLYEHMLRRAAVPESPDALTALAEMPAEQDCDLAAQLDLQRRLQKVDAALEELAPKAHAAFVLQRRDGFSLDEIARQLGVSRPMVKKYLAKAMLHCRQRLEPHE